MFRPVIAVWHSIEGSYRRKSLVKGRRMIAIITCQPYLCISVFQPSRRSSSTSDFTEPEDQHDESSFLEPFLHELPQRERDQGRSLEDGRLTRMLLPSDSLELLEKAEKKMLKKRRRNKQKKQRHRHFNDLWVRIEER